MCVRELFTCSLCMWMRARCEFVVCVCVCVIFLLSVAYVIAMRTNVSKPIQTKMVFKVAQQQHFFTSFSRHFSSIYYLSFFFSFFFIFFLLLSGTFIVCAEHTNWHYAGVVSMCVKFDRSIGRSGVCSCLSKFQIGLTKSVATEFFPLFFFKKIFIWLVLLWKVNALLY